MLLELFLTFLKLGAFTFGGGYAMIASIKDIIVEKKKWMSEDKLVEMIAIAESTPGPIAINMATYVGYTKKGIFGSIVATTGVVLPSFLIIFVISLFLQQFMEFKYVQYAFYGINACVSFQICRAGYNLVKKLEMKFLPIFSFTLVFGLLILFEILSISFSSILFIIFAGLLGIIYYGVINGQGGNK